MEVSDLGTLIDFVLSNLFFVIIIGYGLISAISGKKSAADETTKHPSQSRPRHTPVEMERKETPRREPSMGQSLRDIMEQIEKTMNQSFETEKKKEMPKKLVQTASNTYEEQRQIQLQQSTRPERKENAREAVLAKKANSPIYANDLTKPKALSFDRNSVMQGIIYSEILSKPRATNPYQRGVKK